MSDLNTLNKLSVGYKISNGIINAIVEYVMHKNNNILSWPFCDKTASILVSKNVETCLDAMNELNKLSLKNKERKAKVAETPKVEKPKASETKPAKKHEDVSEEELNELLEQFNKMGKRR